MAFSPLDRKVAGRGNEAGEGRKGRFWRVKDKARREKACYGTLALDVFALACVGVCALNCDIYMYTHRGKESFCAREVLQGSPADAEVTA